MVVQEFFFNEGHGDPDYDEAVSLPYASIPNHSVESANPYLQWYNTLRRNVKEATEILSSQTCRQHIAESNLSSDALNGLRKKKGFAIIPGANGGGDSEVKGGGGDPCKLAMAKMKASIKKGDGSFALPKECMEAPNVDVDEAKRKIKDQREKNKDWYKAMGLFWKKTEMKKMKDRAKNDSSNYLQDVTPTTPEEDEREQDIRKQIFQSQEPGAPKNEKVPGKELMDKITEKDRIPIQPGEKRPDSNAYQMPDNEHILRDDCPLNWTKEVRGNRKGCLAPIDYKGKCNPFQEIIDFGLDQKWAWSRYCGAPYRIQYPHCEGDYSQQCPTGWMHIGRGQCKQANGYDGPCGTYIETVGKTTEQKKEIERTCGVRFPCAETKQQEQFPNGACIRDYDRMCPIKFVEGEDGKSCIPGPDYTGNCKERVNVDNWTAWDKVRFMQRCHARWPCKDPKTAILQKLNSFIDSNIPELQEKIPMGPPPETVIRRYPDVGRELVGSQNDKFLGDLHIGDINKLPPVCKRAYQTHQQGLKYGIPEASFF